MFHVVRNASLSLSLFLSLFLLLTTRPLEYVSAAAAIYRFTDKDLKFLLERGSCKLTSLRVQQALWFCCNRHNVNARFEVRGGVKDQTPLHLIVQCIPSSLDQSKNQQKQKDKPIQELQPLSQAMAKDRLDKWSAKKALLQMRNQLERKGVPVEEWTNIHELLCLVRPKRSKMKNKTSSNHQPSTIIITFLFFFFFFFFFLAALSH